MGKVFTFSEVGGHAVNEDAFEVRRHPADDRSLLVVLADGQGGRAGGAAAAQLACRAALDAVVACSVDDGTNASTSWPAFLRRADQAVAADPEAGYTTLIGLAIRGDSLVGASCGDSSVLSLGSGGRKQELTRAQIKNPPVGSGEAVFIPFEAVLRPPWLVLVMSDGVWKYVGWDRVIEAAGRLRGQALIDELQQAARLPGSGKFQDDFTLIVIQDSE